MPRTSAGSTASALGALLAALAKLALVAVGVWNLRAERQGGVAASPAATEPPELKATRSDGDPPETRKSLTYFVRTPIWLLTDP